MSPRDKREAFVRLAEARTNDILKRIRTLSNCANRNAYEYDETDVRRVFSAIEEELRLAKAKFSTARRRQFTLSGEKPRGVE